MIPVNEDRLLVSDSLAGNIPDLEDEKTAFLRHQDAFIICVIETNDISPNDHYFAGKMVAISCEEIIKIDMKVTLSIGFQILKNCFEKKLIADAFQIHHGNDHIRKIGPFQIKSPKILEIDHEMKACTIALDLDSSSS